MSPHNSPWAPAAGDNAIVGNPVSAVSHSSNSFMRAIAPCTVEGGCNGWISENPGRRATASFRRGLCFMVHEPSG